MAEPHVPLTAQIMEVDHQLRHYRTTAQEQVNKRMIRQSEMQLHAAQLEAVYRTLLWFQEHESEIRAAVGERKRQEAPDE